LCLWFRRGLFRFFFFFFFFQNKDESSGERPALMSNSDPVYDILHLF